MPPMSEEEVKAALTGLPGWQLDDGELVKTFRFSSFIDAIEFINRVAEVAEEANHHPDIEVHHSRVHLALHTWTENAVTTKDIALAREIESVTVP